MSFDLERLLNHNEVKVYDSYYNLVIVTFETDHLGVKYHEENGCSVI